MIVITDCDHPSIDTELAVFGAAALRVRLATCVTEEDVIAAGREASGLLVQYAPVTRRVLEALPGVRVVGRYGVGLDTIDVDAAQSMGVPVVNVPEYCVEEVANHTIALILAVTRGIVALDRGVRGGIWDFRLGGELRRPSSQRIGIVGLGRIGRAVALRADALGYEVVASDPKGGDSPWPLMTLEDLLSTSDIVSLHASLTSATHHLIGAAALDLMRPTAVLINTARGRIVDEQALVGALDRGALAGAALDVLEREPISPDSPLIGRSNVVLTPHTAFYSRESIIEMKRRVAERIVAVLAGVS